MKSSDLSRRSSFFQVFDGLIQADIETEQEKKDFPPGTLNLQSLRNILFDLYEYGRPGWLNIRALQDRYRRGGIRQSLGIRYQEDDIYGEQNIAALILMSGGSQRELIFALEKFREMLQKGDEQKMEGLNHHSFDRVLGFLFDRYIRQNRPSKNSKRSERTAKLIELFLFYLQEDKKRGKLPG